MTLITSDLWEIETGLASGYNFLSNTLTPVGLSSDLTFTRTGGIATRTRPDGLLENVGPNIPRFMHDPLTGDPQGILLERAQTNSLARTEELDNAVWNPPSISAVVTPNVSANRFGAITFDRLSSDGTNNRRKQQVAHTPGAQTWFGSVTVYKQAAAATLEMRIGMEAGGTQVYTSVQINVVTGAVTRTLGTGVFGAIEYADHWRLWAAVTDNGTANTTRMQQLAVVNAGESVEIGEMNLEPDVLGTYIPAGATQVTRTADILTAPRTIQGAYSAVIEARAAMSTPTNFSHRLIAFHDGTTSNLIHIYRDASQNLILAVTTGGVAQASLNLGNIANGALFKVAFAVKANDIAASITGGTVQTDTAASLPAITTMNIGSDPNNTHQWSSTIASIKEFNGQRLSNTELQNLVAL